VPPDPLFAAALQRRTHRAPYGEQVPDDQALLQLAAAARRPGLTWHNSTDATTVQRLRELAMAGYRVEFANAATWAETAEVMRVGAAAVAAEPSGIAVTGTMAWFGRQLGMLDAAALRDTGGVAARRAIEGSIDAATHTHAWGWLSSADNSRRLQIEAGRAYLRADLAAAQLGLAIHTNSQVLQEFEAMSTLYRQFHDEVGVRAPARVQMLVRLGHAARPGPAPRRPLARFVRR
jgi:hypothetical protein